MSQFLTLASDFGNFSTHVLVVLKVQICLKINDGKKLQVWNKSASRRVGPSSSLQRCDTAKPINFTFNLEKRLLFRLSGPISHRICSLVFKNNWSKSKRQGNYHMIAFLSFSSVMSANVGVFFFQSVCQFDRPTSMLLPSPQGPNNRKMPDRATYSRSCVRCVQQTAIPMPISYPILFNTQS